MPRVSTWIIFEVAELPDAAVVALDAAVHGAQDLHHDEEEKSGSNVCVHGGWNEAFMIR
jgi:hypothetical protein